jgi:alginate O-acetyltransferase complex protein AlgJ
MLSASSLRYRYTQFFVLFMLCSFIYVMVQSIDPGVTNFQDNLYKKDFLIEKANLLRIKIGDRVFPAVLLGKDGWMHYTGDGELNYFQNTRKMENEKELVKKLTTLNQYLKSQGITLLIVVAPDKSTIYPDKLPEQIKPISMQSWLDSLISYAGDNNLPVIVDLRPALRTARQDQDVFFKTDTHWNGYGAFAAYTTIVSALGSSYPELKPYKISDLNLKLVTKGPEIRDTPRILEVTTITEPASFFAPKKAFVQTLHPVEYFGYNQFSSIQDSKLPTLLMFHDSQGVHYLNDYLSMNFGKSHFIHFLSMPEYLTRESIQQFKPDIIIIETVERGLEQLNDLLVHWESP